MITFPCLHRPDENVLKSFQWPNALPVVNRQPVSKTSNIFAFCWSAKQREDAFCGELETNAEMDLLFTKITKRAKACQAWTS